MNKVLVVYYSKSGNTRNVAKAIAKRENADLYEIKTKKEFGSDMGALFRLMGDSLLPLSKVNESTGINLSDYDHIYVGTPVWGLTYSLPIKEFLSNTDFFGKKVSLFCTHDGGVGHTIRSMKRKLNNAKFDKAIDIISSNSRNATRLNGILDEWIIEERVTEGA